MIYLYKSIPFFLMHKDERHVLHAFENHRSREDTMSEGRQPVELPHVRGQGQQPGGATPRPRSGSCAGAEGPRGAIPH